MAEIKSNLSKTEDDIWPRMRTIESDVKILKTSGRDGFDQAVKDIIKSEAVLKADLDAKLRAAFCEDENIHTVEACKRWSDYILAGVLIVGILGAISYFLFVYKTLPTPNNGMQQTTQEVPAKPRK
jgi:hypothetical protein